MKPLIEIHFSFIRWLVFWKGRCYRPNKREFLINHARSGIILALQSLNLPPDSKVGVMAYNCHTVFNAVVQAGFRPVFLDVTHDLKLDLEDLKRKKEDISVIVVTHLFGILNDLNDVRFLCPEIPIIEDCAQAYGIGDYQGDISVVSIGQGKLLSIGDGGILYVNNEKYLSEVVRLFESLPEYSSFEELRLFGKLWIWGVLYHPFVYTLITEPMKRLKPHSSGLVSIKVQRMSKGIRRIYENERRRTFEIIRERRQNAKSLINSINDSSVSFICGENAFMLIAQCENPKRLSSCFIKQGIESATRFAQCIDWARNFGYQDGMCPKAEYLTKHLLMIPTYGCKKTSH